MPLFLTPPLDVLHNILHTGLHVGALARIDEFHQLLVIIQIFRHLYVAFLDGRLEFIQLCDFEVTELLVVIYLPETLLLVAVLDVVVYNMV